MPATTILRGNMFGCIQVLILVSNARSYLRCPHRLVLLVGKPLTIVAVLVCNLLGMSVDYITLLWWDLLLINPRGILCVVPVNVRCLDLPSGK